MAQLQHSLSRRVFIRKASKKEVFGTGSDRYRGSAAPGDSTLPIVVNSSLVDNTYGYYLDLDMRKPLNGDVNSLWFYQAQIEYVVP